MLSNGGRGPPASSPPPDPASVLLGAAIPKAQEQRSAKANARLRMLRCDGGLVPHFNPWWNVSGAYEENTYSDGELSDGGNANATGAGAAASGVLSRSASGVAGGPVLKKLKLEGKNVPPVPGLLQRSGSPSGSSPLLQERLSSARSQQSAGGRSSSSQLILADYMGTIGPGGPGPPAQAMRENPKHICFSGFDELDPDNVLQRLRTEESITKPAKVFGAQQFPDHLLQACDQFSLGALQQRYFWNKHDVFSCIKTRLELWLPEINKQRLQFLSERLARSCVLSSAKFVLRFSNTVLATTTPPSKKEEIAAKKKAADNNPLIRSLLQEQAKQNPIVQQLLDMEAVREEKKWQQRRICLGDVGQVAAVLTERFLTGIVDINNTTVAEILSLLLRDVLVRDVLPGEVLLDWRQDAWFAVGIVGGNTCRRFEGVGGVVGGVLVSSSSDGGRGKSKKIGVGGSKKAGAVGDKAKKEVKQHGLPKTSEQALEQAQEAEEETRQAQEVLEKVGGRTRSRERRGASSFVLFPRTDVWVYAGIGARLGDVGPFGPTFARLSEPPRVRGVERFVVRNFVFRFSSPTCIANLERLASRLETALTRVFERALFSSLVGGLTEPNAPLHSGLPPEPKPHALLDQRLIGSIGGAPRPEETRSARTAMKRQNREKNAASSAAKTPRGDKTPLPLHGLYSIADLLVQDGAGFVERFRRNWSEASKNPQNFAESLHEALESAFAVVVSPVPPAPVTRKLLLRMMIPTAAQTGFSAQFLQHQGIKPSASIKTGGDISLGDLGRAVRTDKFLLGELEREVLERMISWESLGRRESVWA